MRKLLIKLVAIETALVGWLSYWLFLVYANNPSVAAELSSSLQRFPQTSFSTIDIAVLVIIAALAVTMAFRFQRGLRPGIRLERALQMLENLMKRNLVLEAQVAELKIEKSHTPPAPTIAPVVSTPSPEPSQGSWEKAFRTPLEAGPPIRAKATTSMDATPFSNETGVPPPRIEPKVPTTTPMIQPPILVSEKSIPPPPPPTVILDKPFEKSMIQAPPKPPSSMWEDSPQVVGETRGILTPSSSARRAPVVSDSGGLKQQYIPAPVPKIISPTPASDPSPALVPKISNISQAPRITARPTPRPSIAKPPVSVTGSQPGQDSFPKAETSTPPSGSFASSLSSSKPDTSIPPPTETDTSIKMKDQVASGEEKTNTKQIQPTRRKVSLDGT